MERERESRRGWDGKREKSSFHRFGMVLIHLHFVVFMNIDKRVCWRKSNQTRLGEEMRNKEYAATGEHKLVKFSSFCYSSFVVNSKNAKCRYFLVINWYVPNVIKCRLCFVFMRWYVYDVNFSAIYKYTYGRFVSTGKTIDRENKADGIEKKSSWISEKLTNLQWKSGQQATHAKLHDETMMHTNIMTEITNKTRTLYVISSFWRRSIQP